MADVKNILLYNFDASRIGFLDRIFLGKYSGFKIATITAILRFLSADDNLIVSVQNKFVYTCVYEDWKKL